MENKELFIEIINLIIQNLHPVFFGDSVQSWYSIQIQNYRLDIYIYSNKYTANIFAHLYCRLEQPGKFKEMNNFTNNKLFTFDRNCSANSHIMIKKVFFNQ